MLKYPLVTCFPWMASSLGLNVQKLRYYCMKSSASETLLLPTSQWGGVNNFIYFDQIIVTFFSRSTFAPTRFLTFQSVRTLPRLVFKGSALYFLLTCWALRLAALRAFGCNTSPSDCGNFDRNSLARSSSFTESSCKSLGFIQLYVRVSNTLRFVLALSPSCLRELISVWSNVINNLWYYCHAY